MEFKELIDAFAKRHGIADLAPEDDGISLDIDGIVVAVVAVGCEVVLSAEIGEPPIEGRAEFADVMLEASMESAAFSRKALRPASTCCCGASICWRWTMPHLTLQSSQSSIRQRSGARC